MPFFSSFDPWLTRVSTFTLASKLHHPRAARRSNRGLPKGPLDRVRAAGPQHFSAVLGAVATLFSVGPTLAEPPPPAGDFIDATLLAELGEFVAQPAVRAALASQNRATSALQPAEIEALDRQWVAERGQPSQPLVSRALANPLSTYVAQVQAGSVGLIVQILAFDAKGLNAGISSVTSDYWQGDEAKWTKTVGANPRAVFIDEPEFDEEFSIWRAQVSFAVPDEAGSIALGGVTFEINLTELARRRAAGL